ncbi:MAG: DnaB-like helicase C-terminal domain-containing protein, partial [Streptosporangiaceae bacterium]
GDFLLGADGRPTRVVAATEVMTGRPCFEVEFSDGTVIVADAGHQWRTTTLAEVAGGPEIVTTAELAAALRALAGGQVRPAVAVAEPAELPARDLPFPPYSLGAWLGCGLDGGARITAGDPEIVLAVESEGGGAGQEAARAVLGGLGVLIDRHIPPLYLRASQAQRRALLAGLLDVGGRVDATGTIQLMVSGRRLAAGALELILSLGYRATMTAAAGYTVAFTPGDKVFGLTRKLAQQATAVRPEERGRLVTDVRPVASVPVRCVQVDNADHMYLAGRTWIPTHNSTLALDFARSAAVHAGMTTVIFSLEMSRNEITMRLLSAEARVGLHAMRTGQLGDEDWTRLARRMSEVADSPLFIDDSPNMSMMEIRAKCRRLKQRNDLRLVIIDYLQLMSSPKRVENRQQEVSELSRSLKLLAKELNVPVIALSQLNRGPEQRNDKRPLLSDLRESGCLTAATRIMRADTNAEVTLGELMATGATDIPVWALDERLRYVPATMTHVFPTGRRRVFRLRLRSGRQVEATMNHRFLTLDGWRPLASLAPGSRIASQRSAHHPLAPPADAPQVDTIPAGVWQRVRDVLAEKEVGDRRFAIAGTRADGAHATRLTRVADVLDVAGMDLLAINDVIWDRIVAIEPLGEQEVYDATVVGLHNFVANGIAAHNSIEQDSDMVILLHREDAYERESPRAGEADFIVAKHRNGPTTTVTVAFQGHYSRFVDMAPI